jgi:hypothetical protein
LLPLALPALPDFPAEPAFAFPEDGFELALAELVVCFLAAQASEPNSENAASDAKKLRRFKSFLRQRQPVAETKRPCH